MRLDGVAQVASSTSKKMIAVVYQSGATFQPKALRDAVGELEITLVRLHIAARGQVQEENGKQLFIAGKDRFLLVDPPQLPPDSPIGVVGVVDDSASPYQLKIDNYKVLTK